MIEPVIGFLWIAIIWGLTLRRRWHRNWRVVGTLLAATCLLVGYLWIRMPFGWVPGVLLSGLIFWLTEVDSQWVRTMPDVDHAYAMQLRRIDAEAAAALADVADTTNVGVARNTLAQALSELRDHAPDPAWQRVAQLKKEEFEIAIELISAPRPDFVEMLDRQRGARTRAKAEFEALMTARSPFWG